MEYSFELQHEDGGSEGVCDPGNPSRVGGAFGEKSVLALPEDAGVVSGPMNPTQIITRAR